MDIIREADVSASTFQNIFRTKDGVLIELVQDMFAGQFGAAESIAGTSAPPVHVYAAETAIQLALIELNSHLRDIYLEAYTNPTTAEFINRETAVRLKDSFGIYQPKCTLGDFYEMEIGSAGLMRAYMAHPCDVYFTLERKIERFLSMSLAAYRVPTDEIEDAVTFVQSLDIRQVAERVMQNLFSMLSMHFAFAPLTAEPKKQTP